MDANLKNSEFSLYGPFPKHNRGLNGWLLVRRGLNRYNGDQKINRR